MEIDETLNAVELKKAGNTISPSNSNSFTESVGIGKANCRKLLLKTLKVFKGVWGTFWSRTMLSIGRNHYRGSTHAAGFI